MKGTRNIALIGIGALVLILFVWGCGVQRKLVDKDEDVKTGWANVQSAYQRRADLIPNLVKVVRSEATFEQETLIKTIEARYKNLNSIKINPDDLNNETFQKFQEAQGQMSGLLNRLMVTVENYPTLRANDGFRALQQEIAGTENRINKARDDFNLTVNSYNKMVRKFPANTLAGMLGFKKRDAFEAKAEAQDAPELPDNIMDSK